MDAENSLRLLLGLSDVNPLEPTDTLALASTEAISYDLDQINLERSDMKAMQDGVDAARNLVHMRQSQLLPTLNAFAAYEWNGYGLSESSEKNWTVGAVLRWDIFPGFDQIGASQQSAAQLAFAETRLAQTQAANANHIRSALGTLATSKKLVELSIAMVAQAAEQRRIMEERYATGLERTADLLQAGAKYSDARLKHLEAVFQHTAAVFTIEFLLERKVSQ